MPLEEFVEAVKIVLYQEFQEKNSQRSLRSRKSASSLRSFGQEYTVKVKVDIDTFVGIFSQQWSRAPLRGP